MGLALSYLQAGERWVVFLSVPKNLRKVSLTYIYIYIYIFFFKDLYTTQNGKDFLSIFDDYFSIGLVQIPSIIVFIAFVKHIFCEKYGPISKNRQA